VTYMRDIFDYVSPLGIIGKIADELFLFNPNYVLEDRYEAFKYNKHKAFITLSKVSPLVNVKKPCKACVCSN